MIYYSLGYIGISILFFIGSILVNYFNGKQVYLEGLMGIMLYSLLWPLTLLGIIAVWVMQLMIIVIEFFTKK